MFNEQNKIFLKQGWDVRFSFEEWGKILDEDYYKNPASLPKNSADYFLQKNDNQTLLKSSAGPFSEKKDNQSLLKRLPGIFLFEKINPLFAHKKRKNLRSTAEKASPNSHQSIGRQESIVTDRHGPIERLDGISLSRKKKSQFTDKKKKNMPPSDIKKSPPSPIFIGRHEPLKRLTRIFLKSESGGTVLISGYRGVGKTSFVDRALFEAKLQWLQREKPIRPNFHVVKLEYSQIASSAKKNSENTAIDPETLLKNIIKQVYRNFIIKEAEKHKDHGIFQKIKAIKNIIRVIYQNLYIKKPIKQKYKDLTKEVKELYYLKVWQKKEKGWQDRLNDLLETSLKKTYGAFLERHSNLEKQEVTTTHSIEHNSKINYLLPLIIILALILKFIGVADNFQKEIFIAISGMFLVKELIFRLKWSKIYDRISQISTAHEVDASIGSLNHDLENIIEHLATDHEGKKNRIIIVIDELDKINQTDDLDGIIKNFKNLFTLTNAVFVFITDKSYYDYLEKKNNYEKINNRNYSLQHTFYTHRIFLPKPEFFDLLGFFRIVDENGNPTDIDLKKDFKESAEKKRFSNLYDFIEFLCFEARDHFFDLLYVLRDHVNYETYDNPWLSMDNENGFGSKETRKAYFHRMVYFIYEEGKYLRESEAHLNSVLLSKLYSIFDFEGSSSFKLEDVQFSSPDSIMNESDGKIEWLSANEKDRINMLIKRLVDFLIERDALKLTENSSYKFTGKCDIVYERPPISEEEQDFLNKIEPILKYFIELHSLFLLAQSALLKADLHDYFKKTRKMISTAIMDLEEIKDAIETRKQGVYTMTEFDDHIAKNEKTLKDIVDNLVEPIEKILNSEPDLSQKLIRSSLNLRRVLKIDENSKDSLKQNILLKIIEKSFDLELDKLLNLLEAQPPTIEVVDIYNKLANVEDNPRVNEHIHRGDKYFWDKYDKL